MTFIKYYSPIVNDYNYLNKNMIKSFLSCKDPTDILSKDLCILRIFIAEQRYDIYESYNKNLEEIIENILK